MPVPRQQYNITSQTRPRHQYPKYQHTPTRTYSQLLPTLQAKLIRHVPTPYQQRPQPSTIPQQLRLQNKLKQQSNTPPHQKRHIRTTKLPHTTHTMRSQPQPPTPTQPNTITNSLKQPQNQRQLHHKPLQTPQSRFPHTPHHQLPNMFQTRTTTTKTITTQTKRTPMHTYQFQTPNTSHSTQQPPMPLTTNLPKPMRTQ